MNLQWNKSAPQNLALRWLFLAACVLLAVPMASAQQPSLPGGSGVGAPAADLPIRGQDAGGPLGLAPKNSDDGRTGKLERPSSLSQESLSKVELDKQLFGEITSHRSVADPTEYKATRDYTPLSDRSELKFKAGGFEFHSPSLSKSPSTSELYEAISMVLKDVTSTYHTTSKSADKEELHRLTTKLTSYLFQIQQQVRKAELTELTQRIEKLKQSIARREEQSEAIIAKRVSQMLQLDDEQDFVLPVAPRKIEM